MILIVFLRQQKIFTLRLGLFETPKRRRVYYLNKLFFKFIQLAMGQYRSQPEKTKKTQLGQSKRLNFVATGMCGWRNFMQDAHISKATFVGNMSLFAVFDGHGGGQVARFTQKHFPEQLANNENFSKKKYELALSETFLKMDRMLQTSEGQKQLKKIKKDLIDKQNADNDEHSYAGCTAVVALITETDIYVANAGDSRCVISAKGKAEAMSFDHKPNDEKELARIKKAGGEVFEGRVNGNLNLSRAIGDLEYKNNASLKPDEQLITCKPDVLKKPLAGVDYLIMGCDGIFEVKTNQEIVDMVLSRLAKKSLKQAAEDMLQALLAPNTQSEAGLDNMTLIIVKFKG